MRHRMGWPRKWLALFWAFALAAAPIPAWGSASAQSGVVYFTGTVTIDGTPAPGGTTVEVLGRDRYPLVSVTGSDALPPYAFRLAVPWQWAPGDGVLLFDVPGLVMDPPVTATFSADAHAAVALAATTPQGPLPPWQALREVESVGLELAMAFNYATGRYQAYVPSLPGGNSLQKIEPHSVLFLTMKSTAIVWASGTPFLLRAGEPVPVPVGDRVMFRLTPPIGTGPAGRTWGASSG